MHGLGHTVCFFQRRWWLIVILKYNDRWRRFLLSLTLKGLFQTFAKSIFFCIFLLRLCVISIFLSYLFLCVHPWLQFEGDLVRGWIQAAVAEINRAYQSPQLQNIHGCVRREERGRGKVMGGWWDGGGSKWEEAWWPESFRKQLARCFTNFRTNLISCYQSCRTLCCAWLQMCLWVFFSFCWILLLNCLYSFDWASRKMQICGTTDCLFIKIQYSRSSVCWRLIQEGFYCYENVKFFAPQFQKELKLDS